MDHGSLRPIENRNERIYSQKGTITQGGKSANRVKQHAGQPKRAYGNKILLFT